jgi:site-specific recombinase XerD
MSLRRKSKRTTYLTAYRRHAKTCTEKKSDLRCDCPIWCQGKVNGEYVRESLNTVSMATAEVKIRERLDRPPEPGGPNGGLRILPGGVVTLEQAEASFVKINEGKAAKTVSLYGRLVAHFRRYAEAHGVTELRRVETALMQQYFAEYENEWKSPRTRVARFTVLAVYFNYCVEMRWLPYSPLTKSLKKSLNPSGVGYARIAYTKEEVARILAAVEKLPKKDRDWARALILLLLGTGCRISDAVWAQRAFLVPGNLYSYIAIKTRKRIQLAPELQKPVLAALAKLPASRVFFFQPDREGDYREAVTALASKKHFQKELPEGLYQEPINRAEYLIRLAQTRAKVATGFHRFRDTFAIHLLQGSVDIFSVSQMLGHSDVKITVQHYVNPAGYTEKMSQATRKLSYFAAA